MDTRLIDFFGVALKSNDVIDSHIINQIATRAGYIVHPDCCNRDVKDWLEEKNCNWNSTFYKNWEDVTNRNRLELFLDQVISYAVNYGLGGNFDMNDHDYSEVPEIRKYKIIMPIEKKDLVDKCLTVLYSGIALKQDTMEALCNFVYMNGLKTLDVDKVKNKEAQIWLIDKTGTFPSDKFAVLRYIYYKVTGEAMIVKDKNVIVRMKIGNRFDLSKLDSMTLRNLSSIFYRYKPVFLGLRYQSASNKKIVNKLRKMAKKNHEPMIMGFWEEVVNKPCMPTQLAHQLKNNAPSNFKLVRLIQSIRENKLKIGTGKDVYNMYPIRNGKVWFEKMPEMNALDQRYDWWDLLEEILYNELVERLKKKACNVKLPLDLHLTCPTSEKSFVGNIPFGSHYTMDHDTLVGIYWKEEWGTRDFDLSFVMYDGSKIGWNSDFYTDAQDIIYSGDMTHADPEAAEVLYMRSGCPNGMVKVNRYSGNKGSKYVFSVGQRRIDQWNRNYMIDPNDIKFSTETTSNEAEDFVGFVNDNELYLCNFKTGDGCVSSVMTSDQYGQVLKRKALSFVDLRQLLVDAGFKIYKRSSSKNPVDLDLSELRKDDLISLFSEA